MSKRSKKPGRQKADDLRGEGQRYFDGGNYRGAVQAWERLERKTPTKVPVAELAEAHFRCGVQGLYDAGAAEAPGDTADSGRTAAVQDLIRAVELVPTEPRYLFHLGLAAHRQGDVTTAIECYHQARRKPGEFADRAAYPLAVALLTQGVDLSTEPLWALLTIEQQGLLQYAGAFQRHPYSVSGDAPALLRALALLDQAHGQREWDTARSLLQGVLAARPSPVEAGTAHFYLGGIAAREEEWEQALSAWQAAREAGFKDARLDENMSELLHRRAEELAKAGETAGALAAAQEAAAYGGPGNALKKLLSHLYQVEGYRAAQSEQWDEALRQWKEVVRVEGDSFAVAYNRALTYERIEAFYDAADTWREALRRRPRSAGRSDAIGQEQVARLWRRAAECYVKAGDYEEAIQVYRTAVKWDPDNIETRLMLAEGLYHNGSLQAAENELQRILEKDPDHIPTLLLMAEVVMASDYWWANAAPAYWQRVLQLDPDNEIARQGLVDHYLNQAQQMAAWSGPEAALQICRLALDVSPEDPRALGLLGGFSLKAGHVEAGQAALDSALKHAGSNWGVRSLVCEIQLSEASEDAFWSTLTRVEAEAGPDAVPYTFYLALAAAALRYGSESILSKMSDRAVTSAPEGTPILTGIGEMLILSPMAGLAPGYFERAVKADEPLGVAYTGLVLSLLRSGQSKEARHFWYQGRAAARKAKDVDAIAALEALEAVLGAPPEWVEMMIVTMYGNPGGPPMFLDDDDYDDEDDYDYDL